MRKILVIGNGPSLRGVDLESLTVDTLGMNAAYRHWERINWYPTWYCCLDDQLMITHHKEIKALVMEGKVRGAFLHISFFDFHPDCLGDKRFYSFPQFSSAAYHAKAKPLGLPFYDSPAFSTADPSKVTTGSHAVRFATFLGYQEIGILGVDLKYTELLPEAARTSSIGLKIKKTPKTNPNYFFDDYQRKGDLYNVPNPDVHGGKLHLDAFRLIPRDFKAEGLSVRVVNCNPDSGLQEHGILPFESLERFLRPALGAVVVPCNYREEAQLLCNLKLWANPRLTPYLTPPTAKPTLVFSFNNDTGAETAAKLQELFDELELDRFFDRVEFRYMGLEGASDVYQRNYSEPAGEQGYKAGPNNQFFRTMRECRDFGRAVFLMESDCIPVRPNWLGHLQDLAEAAGDFFVIGSALRGSATIRSDFAQHLNGNAIYASGSEAFQAFMQDFWKPELAREIEVSDRTLAYDCFLSLYFSQMNSESGEDERWSLWRKTSHLFQFTNAIQNHSGKFDSDNPDPELIRNVLNEDHDTYLVHSQPVADAALDQLALYGNVDPSSWVIGGDQDGFDLMTRVANTGNTSRLMEVVCHPTVRLDVEGYRHLSGDWQEHWAFILMSGSPKAGERIDVALQLELLEAAELKFVIERHGSGTWELGEEMRFALGAGQQRVTVHHAFEFDQESFRIRIGTVSEEARVRVVSALGVATSPYVQPPGSPMVNGGSDSVQYPRLLMIDSTPLGGASATGQLKAQFLGDWPKERFLQVWEEHTNTPTLQVLEMSDSGVQSEVIVSEVELLERCAAFNPDVIYFRPVDYPLITQFAERAVSELDKPLVVHIMDDWQERMREDDPGLFSVMDAALRRLLDYSSGNLSICRAMSEEYEQRYGVTFSALANGVDMSRYTGKAWNDRGPVGGDKPFTVRYLGALADDMTFSSVCEVAEAVAEAGKTLPVAMEIYTMDWCRPKAEQRVGHLPGVSFHKAVTGDAYLELLHGADALLIAYNFDPASIRYVRLSMANKMPECLATGAPLIAYGPDGVATIDYLKGTDVCKVVTERNQQVLVDTLVSLASDLEGCRAMGERAREFVRQNHTLETVQETFRTAMSDATLQSGKTSESVHVGPHARKAEAHFDETEAIALYFQRSLKGSVMIDVGANHGGALAPFLDEDWTVFAFEPDNKNRDILEKRLAGHPQGAKVILDPRAVADEPSAGIDFYTSPESHGISGLSAFRDSHSVSQQVEVTTLRDAIDFDALSAIDFLKIDTEGHDLFVLKGYPWERMLPSVVECEFEDAKTVPLGYNFHDIAGYLVDKGYHVFVSEWHPVKRYGIRHNWRRLTAYPCEVAPGAWGNLVAFKDTPDTGVLVESVASLLELKAEATAPVTAQPDEVSSASGTSGFQRANQLWRAGKLKAARDLYIELFKKSPLQIYRDNADSIDRLLAHESQRRAD